MSFLCLIIAANNNSSKLSIMVACLDGQLIGGLLCLLLRVLGLASFLLPHHWLSGYLVASSLFWRRHMHLLLLLLVVVMVVVRRLLFVVVVKHKTN